MKKELCRDDELEYQGFCECLDKKSSNRFIKIDFGRSVYYFEASEIILNLPAQVLELGIQRGKVIGRASSFRRRCEAGQAAVERKLNKMIGV